jgi:CRISPR/Cas system-associated protein Csm6
MCGDHAKREIMTGDTPAGSGKTLSRESGNKYKEESSSSIMSHRRGDKNKKKMKQVVYYETDSNRPDLCGLLNED